jgi:hypothetical protein
MHLSQLNICFFITNGNSWFHLEIHVQSKGMSVVSKAILAGTLSVSKKSTAVLSKGKTNQSLCCGDC